MSRVTFVTEAGEPTIDRSEVERIRDDLLSSGGVLSGRSHAAATTIHRALSGDQKVELAHAERLAADRSA